jgi:hypothetical protein
VERTAVNLAEVELTSFVGQTVDADLYQWLIHEAEWRHQGRWQFFGDLAADGSFFIWRLVCEQEPRQNGKPPSLPSLAFSGPDQAQAWGLEQGVFVDALHAQQAYELIKREHSPKNAATMWSLWIKYVYERKPA